MIRKIFNTVMTNLMVKKSAYRDRFNETDICLLINILSYIIIPSIIITGSICYAEDEISISGLLLILSSLIPLLLTFGTCWGNSIISAIVSFATKGEKQFTWKYLENFCYDEKSGETIPVKFFWVFPTWATLYGILVLIILLFILLPLWLWFLILLPFLILCCIRFFYGFYSKYEKALKSLQSD